MICLLLNQHCHPVGSGLVSALIRLLHPWMYWARSICMNQPLQHNTVVCASSDYSTFTLLKQQWHRLCILIINLIWLVPLIWVQFYFPWSIDVGVFFIPNMKYRLYKLSNCNEDGCGRMRSVFKSNILKITDKMRSVKQWHCWQISHKVLRTQQWIIKGFTYIWTHEQQ